MCHLGCGLSEKRPAFRRTVRADHASEIGPGTICSHRSREKGEPQVVLFDEFGGQISLVRTYYELVRSGETDKHLVLNGR